MAEKDDNCLLGMESWPLRSLHPRTTSPLTLIHVFTWDMYFSITKFALCPTSFKVTSLPFQAREKVRTGGGDKTMAAFCNFRMITFNNSPDINQVSYNLTSSDTIFLELTADPMSQRSSVPQYGPHFRCQTSAWPPVKVKVTQLCDSLWPHG